MSGVRRALRKLFDLVGTLVADDHKPFTTL
jgi:hypothetical protein